MSAFFCSLYWKTMKVTFNCTNTLCVSVCMYVCMCVYVCVCVCRVEVWLDPQESLGISIVGGHAVIKRLKNGEELRGIFIKQVLQDSPAGRTRALRTGDKILQVLTHTHTGPHSSLTHTQVPTPHSHTHTQVPTPHSHTHTQVPTPPQVPSCWWCVYRSISPHG